MNPQQRTRIKMCGFTREADVLAACAAGADAIGFVLYPPSPRSVSIERAAADAVHRAEKPGDIHGAIHRRVVEGDEVLHHRDPVVPAHRESAALR